jgi:heme A synthase
MQLILGLLNVTLLAPVWLQMVHLLVADLVWISLVLLSLAMFSQAPVVHEISGEEYLKSLEYDQ